MTPSVSPLYASFFADRRPSGSQPRQPRIRRRYEYPVRTPAAAQLFFRAHYWDARTTIINPERSSADAVHEFPPQHEAMARVDAAARTVRVSTVSWTSSLKKVRNQAIYFE